MHTIILIAKISFFFFFFAMHVFIPVYSAEEREPTAMHGILYCGINGRHCGELSSRHRSRTA